MASMLLTPGTNAPIELDGDTCLDFYYFKLVVDLKRAPQSNMSNGNAELSERLCMPTGYNLQRMLNLLIRLTVFS